MSWSMCSAKPRRHSRNRGGRLTFVSSAGSFCYVVARMRWLTLSEQQIAMMAHELQHALEIAERPAIVDSASLAREYRKMTDSRAVIGAGRIAFDTDAAKPDRRNRVTGDQGFRSGELEFTSDRSSVRRWAMNRVDDEEGHRDAAPLQSETELFFKRVEDRRSVGVGGAILSPRSRASRHYAFNLPSAAVRGRLSGIRLAHEHSEASVRVVPPRQ